ncbi:MAG: hypothetical protein PSX80_07715 [bacterium]|nr:hypothetical protein [bacterium]
MRRYLYLASDEELPLIKWEESRPAFNVDQLQDYDLDVVKQFSKPYMVFLGAHTSCGCGFLYDSEPRVSEDEVQDDQDARASVKLLVAYLEEQAKRSSLELFACWNGDQGEVPVERISVKPGYFDHPTEFPIGDEPTFFTISKI